jgi:hypothetical protein
MEAGGGNTRVISAEGETTGAIGEGGRSRRSRRSERNAGFR